MNRRLGPARYDLAGTRAHQFSAEISEISDLKQTEFERKETEAFSPGVSALLWDCTLTDLKIEKEETERSATTLFYSDSLFL